MVTVHSPLVPAVARTAPPFPTPPPFAVEEEQAPQIHVYMDGHELRVDRLGIHFVEGQGGAPLVRLAVSYRDAAGAKRTRETWLQALT